MPQYTDNKPSHYISPGMPELKLGKTTSFFEFWPTWLMYIPVVLQWLILALRHRSLTLPLIANPQIPLSGMVGVSKSEILAQAKDELEQTILPWMVYQKTDAPLFKQWQQLEQEMERKGFQFPLVCKPDIGCRGVGVKLVHNSEALQNCLSHYNVGSSLMLQKLSDFEPEVGIYFVRQPDASQGQITSMALKYMPYVVGDGQHTFGELIEQDERAGPLVHLYQKRHQKRWNDIVPQGQPVRLVFSASHSKGAIFKDAHHLITPELTQKLNTLMKQLPDFHYGRLDVKFQDADSLKAGQTLQIVEINAASSESLHIWDSNTDIKEAMHSLLLQYRTLFSIGAANRNKGFTPPGIVELIRRWRLERKLTQYYPETD
ncbi:MAG: D-alanine--D-alanine ligase [Reinekea sp.]